MRFCTLALLWCLACAAPSARATQAAGARMPDGTGAVSGEVVDAESGEPVALVGVSASRAGELAAADITDAQGRFFLEAVPAGDVSVEARAGDWIVGTQTLEVEPDTEHRLRFRARRPSPDEVGEGDRGAIEGLVVDGSTGLAVPGAVVSLTSPVQRDARFAFADERGRYDFRNLVPATYAVSCYYHLVAEGNVEVRRTGVVVGRGETRRVDLELDLSLRRR